MKLLKRLGLFAVALASLSAKSSIVFDSISAAIPIVSGSMMVAPIHASYLPAQGAFQIVGKAGIEATSQPFAGRLLVPAPDQPLPTSFTLIAQSVPYDIPYATPTMLTIEGAPVLGSWWDSAMCGLVAQIPTGDLLAVSGERPFLGWRFDQATQTWEPRNIVFSVPYGLRHAVGPATWTRDSNLTASGVDGLAGRWYGSADLVPDGGSWALVALGGSSGVDLGATLDPNQATFAFNHSIEVYRPGLGWSALLSHAQGLQAAPTLRAQDYVFARAQPDGSVWASGEDGNSWTVTLAGAVTPLTAKRGTTGQLPNFGASLTRLPDRLLDDWHAKGAVLACGGQIATASEHQCDVIEPSADRLTTIEMGIKRFYSNAVTLLDGTVAAIGGASSDGSTGQEHVQYVDPATRAVTTGSATLPRTCAYHSVKGLDRYGQVLLACGLPNQLRSFSGEQAVAFVIKPPYIAQPRATILGVFTLDGSQVTTVQRGQTYAVAWTGGSSTMPLDIAILAPTSDTHGYESHSRHVQQLAGATMPHPTVPAIRFTLVTVTLNVHLLPDGQDMLVVRDLDGVPSVALPISVTP